MLRIDGRVVEGARLEIVCTPKAYRGFESLSIRHYKNALNKLGVFLSDESVQTSPQACFHGEGSEFS